MRIKKRVLTCFTVTWIARSAIACRGWWGITRTWAWGLAICWLNSFDFIRWLVYKTKVRKEMNKLAKHFKIIKNIKTTTTTTSNKLRLSYSVILFKMQYPSQQFKNKIPINPNLKRKKQNSNFENYIHFESKIDLYISCRNAYRQCISYIIIFI